MKNKQASSQAAWALLMEGVASARVETHRLQHLLVRALELVEQSEQREHLYQVAGDIIEGIPARMERLEGILDRTSLALSQMGESFLSARLPLSDKTLVQEAIKPSFLTGGVGMRKKYAKKLVRLDVAVGYFQQTIKALRGHMRNDNALQNIEWAERDLAKILKITDPITPELHECIDIIKAHMKKKWPVGELGNAIKGQTFSSVEIGTGPGRYTALITVEFTHRGRHLFTLGHYLYLSRIQGAYIEMAGETEHRRATQENLEDTIEKAVRFINSKAVEDGFADIAEFHK